MAPATHSTAMHEVMSENQPPLGVAHTSKTYNPTLKQGALRVNTNNIPNRKRALGDITNSIVNAGANGLQGGGFGGKKGGGVIGGGVGGKRVAKNRGGVGVRGVRGGLRKKEIVERNVEVMESTGYVDVYSSVDSLPVFQEFCVETVAIDKTYDVVVRDIDEITGCDPHLVCREYCNDIFRTFRKREILFMADPLYMTKQPDITAKMRSILIDWLVAVHQKFRLLQETLYLTVNIIDRFLSAKPVKRHKLQLVGVTAMLVAAKYEECIEIPRASDFVFITDEAYTREEILQMEALILKVIAFDVTVPSPLAFLARYMSAARAVTHIYPGGDPVSVDIIFRAKHLASYLLDLSLQHYDMLGHTASERAATAVYLAGKLTGAWQWTLTLQHYSEYTERDLEQCAQKLFNVLLAEQNAKNKLTAITKKFSCSRRYDAVSTIILEDIARPIMSESMITS